MRAIKLRTSASACDAFYTYTRAYVCTTYAYFALYTRIHITLPCITLAMSDICNMGSSCGVLAAATLCSLRKSQTTTLYIERFTRKYRIATLYTRSNVINVKFGIITSQARCATLVRSASVPMLNHCRKRLH